MCQSFFQQSGHLVGTFLETARSSEIHTVMKFARFLFCILIVALFLSACAPADNCTTYGESNIPVCGLILDFYRQHGGPTHLGTPVTRQQRQGELYVQYFENVVVEYPVEEARFDAVQLRSLGLDYYQTANAVVPSEGPGCRFFNAYSQEVCYAFLEHYDRLGGERVIGYPITGMILENGVQVQYFENAKFRLVNDENGPRVELAPWGILACESDRVYCEDSNHGYAGPVPVNAVDQAFKEFITAHGGQAVFGSQLGDLVHMGDMVYQYFQNACLIQFPDGDNPIILAPLGALDAPVVERIAPPAPSETTQYFPVTGHSVVLSFLDFFQQHGGETVFGKPLTEFIQDGDLWVQWFENVRFEWHPELPDGERVQLTPLGQINSDRFQGGLPPTILNNGATGELPTPLPSDIVLTIIPQTPVLTPGETQLVQLVATDSASQPIPDIEIVLYVYTSVTNQLLVAPMTDEQGISWVTISEIDGACEIVQLHAVTQTENSMIFADSQFTLWCNAPSQ